MKHVVPVNIYLGMAFQAVDAVFFGVPADMTVGAFRIVHFIRGDAEIIYGIARFTGFAVVVKRRQPGPVNGFLELFFSFHMAAHARLGHLTAGFKGLVQDRKFCMIRRGPFFDFRRIRLIVDSGRRLHARKHQDQRPNADDKDKIFWVKIHMKPC
jgi:hypothetical protein